MANLLLRDSEAHARLNTGLCDLRSVLKKQKGLGCRESVSLAEAGIQARQWEKAIGDGRCRG